MGQSIVQIKQMGDALRSSGYKSIDSAVAEIIDNSIEANAKDVFVIMREHVDPVTGRKCIYEFAILDNGTGMDDDKLSSCLGIGYTTKADRRGMGRFGVGLPQASLYVTPNVEVYSWQKEIETSDLVCKVWLDIEKVKTGEQKEINDPDLCEIPDWIQKFMTYTTIDGVVHDFTRSGTIVYWKNCDNVKPKTMTSLNDKLEFYLGRKFRHLICAGTHNIRLITVGNEESAINVLPNDPLFLMVPNRVLGNVNDPANISERNNVGCTEPIFERYKDGNCQNGEQVVPIEYIDKKTGEKKKSNVIIRFSKVRAEFYDKTAIPVGDPGSKPIGQYAKKMEGISVVRAGREIDFGVFDFYDKTNSPYHRWWGCEICFEPVLDEVFGVANNKQQVELRDNIQDKDPDAEKGIWEILADKIKSTINHMVAENKELRKGSRSEENDNESDSEKIISNVEQTLQDEEGQAQEEKRNTSEEVLEERAKEFLVNQGNDSPTIEQIRTLLNKEVTIQYKNGSKLGPFMDLDFCMGNVAVTINTSHIFYDEFISKMGDENKIAFELFIGALAKSVNKTNIHNTEQNDQLLSEWDYRLKQYLQQIVIK